jgi:4-hydroxybenzoyl-CoA thioesterase/acyl-CoA thioester hydrolase
MAGIVHFSVYFVYMEESEHEFLRSVGLGVFSQLDGETISWPRVAAACNYRSAIRFEEEVDIHVSLKRIGTTSLTYDHQILRQSDLIADGTVTAVCCRIQPGQPPEPMKIPQEFLERLTPYQIVSDD